MSRYLSVEDILRFHDILIERYGGTKGIRDRSGLESAVARPQIGYYADVVEEAAALLESLSQNHPFLDGNKRTAVSATATFLRMNGRELVIDDMAAYRWLMERYESGTMNKAAIETWLREHVTQI